jgi:hypothetical protein
MPFSLRLIAKPVACRAKPRNKRISREDTLHSPEAATARTDVRHLPLRILPLHHVKDRRPQPKSPAQIVASPDPLQTVRRFTRANPNLVEVSGIEPLTSCLQSRRSPN